MHWMIMPFRRYVDFQGRSRRMEFWMWQLFLFIVNFVFTLLVYVPIFIAIASLASGGFSGRGPSDAEVGRAMFSGLGVFGIVMAVLWMIWGLATFLPNLAVAIRRLHDSNRTGWWAVYPWIAYFVGYILTIVMTIAAGASASSSRDASGLAIVVGILFIIFMLAALGLAITAVVFWFLDGTPGPNRFGPDPKSGERSYDQTFA